MLLNQFLKQPFKKVEPKDFYKTTFYKRSNLEKGSNKVG